MNKKLTDLTGNLPPKELKEKLFKLLRNIALSIQGIPIFKSSFT